MKAEKIVERLRAMHEMAHAAGAKTVAITVPEHGQVRSRFALYLSLSPGLCILPCCDLMPTLPLKEPDLPYIREKRLVVNESLRAIAAGSGGKCTLFDLATQLPMASLSEQDRDKYWDDGTTMWPVCKFCDLEFVPMISWRMAHAPLRLLLLLFVVRSALHASWLRPLRGSAVLAPAGAQAGHRRLRGCRQTPRPIAARQAGRACGIESGIESPPAAQSRRLDASGNENADIPRRLDSHWTSEWLRAG